jgi:acid phosphatase
MIARKFLVLGTVLAGLAAGAAQAQEVAPNDLLLATLWTQRSVEYRANAITVFALARIRLDEGLADKSWTAAPACAASAPTRSAQRSRRTSVTAWPRWD